MPRRILVVDDDEGFRELVPKMLTGTEFEAVSTDSCFDAMHKLQEESIDAILLDVMMPGLDGVASIGQLQSVKPDVPIIIVTAVGNEVVHKDAMRRGAKAVLQKPIVARELLRVLEKALQSAPPAQL